MIAFVAFWFGGMSCFALAFLNEWESSDRKLPYGLDVVPPWRIAAAIAVLSCVWPAIFALLIHNSRARWEQWHRIESTRRESHDA